MSPQSQTLTSNNGHDREHNGVRTYRGRKLDDLIPQIREELGPDAIILRQREGLTGGVGGFFAQRCVEVDAQAATPRVDIYDEEEVDQSLLEEIEDPYADPAPQVTAELPALEAGDVAEEPAHGETPNLIETFYVPTGAIDGLIDQLPDEVEETEETEDLPTGYERHAAEIPTGPSFVERLQEAAGLAASPTPAPVAAEPAPIAPEPAPVATAEPAPVAVEPEPEPEPTPVAVEPEPAPVAAEPEPVAIPAPATAAARAVAPPPIIRPKPVVIPQAVAEPAPVIVPAPAAAPVPAQRAFAAQQSGQIDGDDAAALADELTSQGISETWARRLIDEAAAHRSPLASGNLRDAVRATLASTLPSPVSLPASGAAIAFVGAGGSGKTRCSASLAAAYARASTLAASVVALGGEDWGAEVKDLLKGQSTWVTVAPTATDAHAAVQSGRQNGMVVVDTPATSPRNEAAVQELAAELGALELDALYITIPATFSVHAAKKLVESFAALGADGIAVTHADEAEQLGVAAELAHISGVPIAYVHEGLQLDSALSASDPTSLAARLLP